ncbi:hypothetical protein [Mesorhizobium sp. M0778]|uniref:hypothetical protein n=1 Tax=Mesorhizobium sp. M0778 TaxID=2956999 RepID=UPI003335E49C
MLKRIVGQAPRQGPAQSNRCCALQITLPVLRAIPKTAAICRELVPLPAAEAFVSTVSWSALLFARIKISPFIAGHLMPKMLTQELSFSA